MAKINLSDADRKAVSDTIAQSESKTSGEIAVAVTKESYDYAIYETVFAILGGFLYFVIMSFFVSEIELMLQSMFWNYSVNYLVLFYGFSTFMVIAILYFLANISALDRLIVPPKIRWIKVRERAVRHFMESGVYNTRDRTGILIFISLLERRVELIADSGIAAKISQEKWNNIIEIIISGIKKGELTLDLNKAIRECGSLLQEFFPIKKDDTNELSNEIDILEK
jgi:putative membrane protein